MQITATKLYEMAATIVSGVMANPVHAFMLNDQYAVQNAIQSAFNALEQTMMSKGISIVPD